MNFRKQEVNAYNLEEAASQVDFVNINFVRNATQSWKKAGKPVLKGLGEFMTNYLNEKRVQSAYIILDGGKSDTRERPYKFEDVIMNPEKNPDAVTGTREVVDKETGKKVTVATCSRKYATIIEVTNDRTNEIVYTSEPGITKVDAMREVKELYKEGQLTDDVTGWAKHVVVAGEPKVFTAKYTPSKSAKVGTYLFFGLDD